VSGHDPRRAGPGPPLTGMPPTASALPDELRRLVDVDARLRALQAEYDALRRFLWCVARQQGGTLTVSNAELLSCPQWPGLVSRDDIDGLHIMTGEGWWK
jgi:hypothetical protein